MRTARTPSKTYFLEIYIWKKVIERDFVCKSGGHKYFFYWWKETSELTIDDLIKTHAKSNRKGKKERNK